MERERRARPFRRHATADAAQLVIRSDAREKCGEGRATIGYTSAAVLFVFRQATGEACSRFAAARVLAHEFGRSWA